MRISINNYTHIMSIMFILFNVIFCPSFISFKSCIAHVAGIRDKNNFMMLRI